MADKKKTKGKDKNAKDKKVQLPKGMQEAPHDIVKRLLRAYGKTCDADDSIVCPSLKSYMKECLDENQLITKFILEPVPNFEDPDFSNVQLETLVISIRCVRYKYIKELHIWNMKLIHTQVATLALMLEHGAYPLTRLELVDCDIQSYAVERLMRCLPMSILETLSFDYTELGDEGVLGICKGLSCNKTVLSLSLCFCNLGFASGAILGQIIATTALRDLFLNGNNLEADGILELIRVSASHAEVEHFERIASAQQKLAEQEEQVLLAAAEKKLGRVRSARSSERKTEQAKSGNKSGKGKKKGSKKKKKIKEVPPPPPVCPCIQKLHLADNGLDGCSYGSSYAPIIVTRIFRQLIQHSITLQELDIDDNLIGDLAGREIMAALTYRKEAGHPNIRMSVTHRLNPDIFNTIMDLGSGLKKKAKKGGKKKAQRKR